LTFFFDGFGGGGGSARADETGGGRVAATSDGASVFIAALQTLLSSSPSGLPLYVVIGEYKSWRGSHNGLQGHYINVSLTLAESDVTNDLTRLAALGLLHTMRSLGATSTTVAAYIPPLSSTPSSLSSPSLSQGSLVAVIAGSAGGAALLAVALGCVLYRRRLARGSEVPIEKSPDRGTRGAALLRLGASRATPPTGQTLAYEDRTAQRAVVLGTPQQAFGPPQRAFGTSYSAGGEEGFFSAPARRPFYT
jgi:hypothetical protein